MCALNEHINVALREHNVQQVGGAGSSPLVDTLRSLLAPNNLDAGTMAPKSNPTRRSSCWRASRRAALQI